MVEGFSEEPICESSVSAFTERRGELGGAGVGVGVLAEFCAVLGLPFEGVELGFDNCVWKVLEWEFCITEFFVCPWSFGPLEAEFLS